MFRLFTIAVLAFGLSAAHAQTARTARGKPATRPELGRAVIPISHKVSAVRAADRIFVLENGALGGCYADLYQKQLIEEELGSA